MLGGCPYTAQGQDRLLRLAVAPSAQLGDKIPMHYAKSSKKDLVGQGIESTFIDALRKWFSVLCHLHSQPWRWEEGRIVRIK